MEVVSDALTPPPVPPTTPTPVQAQAGGSGAGSVRPAHAGSVRPAQIFPCDGPQSPNDTTAAKVQRITLQLDEKLGSLATEVETLARPAPRKRRVWGGAQAVERGALRPSSPPTPPKVYSEQAPSMRRVDVRLHSADARRDLTTQAATGSPWPAAATGQARRSWHTKGGQLLRATSSEAFPGMAAIERAAAASPSSHRCESQLLKEGSPTAPRWLPGGPQLRDGLTPGQRALGATGSDEHAGHHALMVQYGRPVLLPRLRPPPHHRAKAGARDQALRALERIEGHRRAVLASHRAAEGESGGRANDVPADGADQQQHSVAHQDHDQDGVRCSAPTGPSEPLIWAPPPEGVAAAVPNPGRAEGNAAAGCGPVQHLGLRQVASASALPSSRPTSDEMASPSPAAQREQAAARYTYGPATIASGFTSARTAAVGVAPRMSPRRRATRGEPVGERVGSHAGVLPWMSP